MTPLASRSSSSASSAKALAEAYVTVIREAYANSAALTERTKALVKGSDPKIIDDVVKQRIDGEIMVPIWGVRPDVIKDAIEFYSSARPYRKIKEPQDVATDRFVSGLSVR